MPNSDSPVLQQTDSVSIRLRRSHFGLLPGLLILTLGCAEGQVSALDETAPDSNGPPRPRLNTRHEADGTPAADDVAEVEDAK